MKVTDGGDNANFFNKMQTSNQITSSSVFFYAKYPSWHPNNSAKAPKA